MNIYTIYADIKEGNNPHDFVKNMRKFLDSLPTLQAYRITRMKLGFASWYAFFADKVMSYCSLSLQ